MRRVVAVLIFGALAASLVTAPAFAAKANKCHLYAKKQADRVVGPKEVERAMVIGATGGIAGQKGAKKKKFYGFGLTGAAIGLIVANHERQKHYKRHFARCMGKA